MIELFRSTGLAASKPKTVMKQLEEFSHRSERLVDWQEYSVQEAGEESYEPDPVQDVLAYMERLEVKAGEKLICQGEQPRGLYFVESGQVTIQLESQDSPPLRLRTRGEGTIVGEMGLYLGSPASASVVVDEPSTLYYLSVESFERMEAEAPAMASAFHKFIAQHLSQQLLGTTQTLQTLLD